MEKFYKVSESELTELIYDSMKLSALESGGVGDWLWFSESIKDFFEANREPEDRSIYDIAIRELENYPEVI